MDLDSTPFFVPGSYFKNTPRYAGGAMCMDRSAYRVRNIKLKDNMKFVQLRPLQADIYKCCFCDETLTCTPEFDINSLKHCPTCRGSFSFAKPYRVEFGENI